MFDKRLIQEVKGSGKYIGQNVALQWLGLLGNIVSIFAIGWLLQQVYLEQVQAAQVGMVALIVLGGILLRYFSTVAATRAGHNAARKVKLDLREKILGKLMRLGGSYKKELSTAEVVQVAVEGVDQLEIYFGQYLPQFFYSLLAPITLFVVLSFVNFRSALVLLICVPLIPLAIAAVQTVAKKLLSQYWGEYTQLGDGFLENLQGLTTLKIYSADERKNEEMNDRAESFRKITMRVLGMQLNSIVVMDLIAYGGAALGVIVAVSQFMQGAMGFAGCFAILLLASEFFIPLRLLGSFFHVAMNGMAASDKIFRLLDLPEEKQGEDQVTEGAKDIQLSHVNFSYDDKRQVLTDVSVRAGMGITALVGESGCGKSTIARLLTGEYSHYSGNMTVGGTEVRHADKYSLREQMTLVTHDSYLCKGTVEEVLRMGNAHASPEEMWNVLERVNLKEFVQSEKGLSTPIAEDAANLSGGQKQRLALARALLKDSPMYIFDEVTSNIDADSEEDIIAAIWDIARTKTVLMISHRLANVVPADRIYVLEKGCVRESGNHGELIAKRGVYARLYHSQQELENMTKLHKSTKEAANA